MKHVAKDLKRIAGQIETLARQAESLANSIATAPAAQAQSSTAGTKKTSVPRAKTSTPTEQVLVIMKRYRNGISVEALRGKSGFNEKQISNIVHRACKKGKMRRLGRGIYSVYGV